MRLWHKDIVNKLPRQQLVSQWRELLAIKRKIDKCGSPQHGLVNKIMDYSIDDFKFYTRIVYRAGISRGYNFSNKILEEILNWNYDFVTKNDSVNMENLYFNWHDDTYLEICKYNLMEKWMCGIVTDEEWNKLGF